MNDTQLYSLEFSLGASVLFFKGFSLNMDGNYEIVRNQINLPAGDVSLEELLLQQQQSQSGLNHFVSIGLSYSFGSIYNTVVNPRFIFSSNNSVGIRVSFCLNFRPRDIDIFCTFREWLTIILTVMLMPQRT
ncbi:MAG: hypothetical protein ACI828_000896 [Flavobacteriales bacterium]